MHIDLFTLHNNIWLVWEELSSIVKKDHLFNFQTVHVCFIRKLFFAWASVMLERPKNYAEIFLIFFRTFISLFSFVYFVIEAATIGVLRNFTKFTGKHLRQRLFFNKVAGLRPATLLKKRFWHRCFPVNFVKFLRTPFFTEHLWATASVVRFNINKNVIF